MSELQKCGSNWNDLFYTQLYNTRLKKMNYFKTTTNEPKQHVLFEYATKLDE